MDGLGGGDSPHPRSPLPRAEGSGVVQAGGVRRAIIARLLVGRGPAVRHDTAFFND